MLKVIISGVNLVEGGILSVLKDTLTALKPLKRPFDLSVTVLVHDKKLVGDLANEYEVLEYPEIKTSWIKRLKFEYITSNQLSKQHKPDLWISLHDMTPNVTCPVQVVYCHNPSPFYKTDWSRFFYDPTFSLFTLFYKYLYGINIKKNAFVIVQQNWIRNSFKKMYGVNSIVAYPILPITEKKVKENSLTSFNIDESPIFFYPAFPRIFKNMETLCKAAEVLKQTNPHFNLVITMSGKENKYAQKIVERFKHIKQIKFIGLQSRETVETFYHKAKCLVFPSKLETWGLPVSEFMSFDKPILISDLPYAHETVGEYKQVKFFNADDHFELANYMQQITQGTIRFDINNAPTPEEPFFTSWDNLLKFLLHYAQQKSNI